MGYSPAAYSRQRSRPWPTSPPTRNDRLVRPLSALRSAWAAWWDRHLRPSWWGSVFRCLSLPPALSRRWPLASRSPSCARGKAHARRDLSRSDRRPRRSRLTWFLPSRCISGSPFCNRRRPSMSRIASPSARRSPSSARAWSPRPSPPARSSSKSLPFVRSTSGRGRCCRPASSSVPWGSPPAWWRPISLGCWPPLASPVAAMVWRSRACSRRRCSPATATGRARSLEPCRPPCPPPGSSGHLSERPSTRFPSKGPCCLRRPPWWLPVRCCSSRPT